MSDTDDLKVDMAIIANAVTNRWSKTKRCRYALMILPVEGGKWTGETLFQSNVGDDLSAMMRLAADIYDEERDTYDLTEPASPS